jgi:hypothetical protein
MTGRSRHLEKSASRIGDRPGLDDAALNKVNLAALLPLDPPHGVADLLREQAGRGGCGGCGGGRGLPDGLPGKGLPLDAHRRRAAREFDDLNPGALAYPADKTRAALRRRLVTPNDRCSLAAVAQALIERPGAPKTAAKAAMAVPV